MIFVREKGLTGIVAKARKTLVGHPQFVEEHESAGETELRVIMRWPGDDDRQADLCALLVHTPAAA